MGWGWWGGGWGGCGGFFFFNDTATTEIYTFPYTTLFRSLVTFNAGAHRLQLGYGRTRAGYNCSGGVCRYVPASKGFTISYNYNF